MTSQLLQYTIQFHGSGVPTNCFISIEFAHSHALHVIPKIIVHFYIVVL